MRPSWTTPKGTELQILNLRGKEYLEVKWRLVWFREEHPDWSIQTEVISTDLNSSLCRATILNQDGKIASMGHKTENKQGFADHLEKAETGAVGRALAMLGYGTQFCADELDEGERIVDAPVVHRAPATLQMRPHQPMNAEEIRAKSFGPPPNSYPRYFIGFGKFKGKHLDEVPLQDLLGYADWLQKSAKTNNKPMGKDALEYISALDAFRKSKASSFTPPIEEDNIPF